MVKIELNKNKSYKAVIKGKVTKSGNGAHIIVPKHFMGENVDVLIEDITYLGGKNTPYGD